MAVPAPSVVPGPAPARRLSGRAAAHLFTLAALLAWWGYSLVVPPYQVPGPEAVALRMLGFLADPALAVQLLVSLMHIGISIAIAFVAGAGLALASAYVPATRMLVDGVLTPFLNAFSGIGWLFLALLWFGLNDVTVIFAVTMILIPFTAINLRTGLQELDGELMELGLSLTRARLRRMTHLVAPLLIPYAFAALRTSFGVSWKVVLTAELFGGNAGVGYVLNIARQEFDTETIFAIIAFILLFVVLCEQLVFRPVQRRLDRRYARG
ncbi:ABC transporter permease [Oceanicella sp. SM1341]|uniref:ABC transporter permease n=1 Tax=Oceanicella sp. SM1341 TaxID=1548889 RepID=UPI000E48F03B|nr:ABC transporter permease subunit [Oceanicella sp. SM1341]